MNSNILFCFSMQLVYFPNILHNIDCVTLRGCAIENSQRAMPKGYMKRRNLTQILNKAFFI